MLAYAEYGLVAIAVLIAGAYLARNLYLTFAGKSAGCHCSSGESCASSTDDHPQNP